jgi:hypothetical protein
MVRGHSGSSSKDRVTITVLQVMTNLLASGLNKCRHLDTTINHSGCST